MTLLDYLGIDDGSLEDRLYLGRSVLADSIDVGIPDSKFPYLLAVSVSLDSPELASQIANSLVGQFMGADLALQARNARERASFINSLVGDVSVDLRFAEDTLDEFMDSNRLLSSISVAAETTRMRRDLEVQREFYLRLRKQALLYEWVKHQETPAISIVEKARPPREPYTLGVRTKVGLAGVGSLLLAMMLTCFAEGLIKGWSQ